MTQHLNNLVCFFVSVLLWGHSANESAFKVCLLQFQEVSPSTGDGDPSGEVPISMSVDFTKEKAYSLQIQGMEQIVPR